MMENEDSVVTSLNELRKLKNERITRQTHSRSAVGAGYAVPVEDPAVDQLTPPPVQGLALAAMRKSAEFDSSAGFASTGPSRGGGYSHAPIGYDSAPAQVLVRPRTSVKAAVAVAIVLIGAGGAGYMKLQNDTQVILAAKDATIRQSEESRNRAVETAARSDQQARTSLRQCEDKLKASMATAPAVTPAPASSVAEKIEKPSASTKNSRTASHRASARSVRQSARAERAEAAAPKSADIPAIAKKKKLDNDPLAGLNKL
jgi:hypothetical protein